jgi:hypothetical protein
MARVDNSGVMQAIANAMLRGRTTDQYTEEHNPDWKYYKMYPEMWDAMQPGDDNFYMTPEPERLHVFGKYAQNEGPFTGQRTAPDLPSARDVQLMERSADPAVRQMFEKSFGTEALDREQRGRTGIRSPDYVPTPRPRPGEAPVAEPEDYLEPLPESPPPPVTPEGEVPDPESMYGVMPWLRDAVKEQIIGQGSARELKTGREDGNRFDRTFKEFSDEPAVPIQDFRLRAIEEMIRRGAHNPQQYSEDLEPDAAHPVVDVEKLKI